MCLKGLQVVVILMIVSLSLCDDGDMYPRGPIVPPPRRPPPDLVNNNLGNGFLNSGLLAASGLMNSGLMNSGFMNTARNFVTSPTGQMAVSMAKEFISRSAGGNQVLSLNLTSLLTLVLLKALIFATGLFSAGNYGQYGRGRGLEGNSIVDNAEMQLFLGFLAAEGSRNDGCLYRAVCMSPEHGAEYLKAAKALLEGFGAFDPAIPEDQRYNEYLQNVQQAVLEGMQNAPCDNIYSCSI